MDNNHSELNDSSSGLTLSDLKTIDVSDDEPFRIEATIHWVMNSDFQPLKGPDSLEAEYNEGASDCKTTDSSQIDTSTRNLPIFLYEFDSSSLDASFHSVEDLESETIDSHQPAPMDDFTVKIPSHPDCSQIKNEEKTTFNTNRLELPGAGNPVGVVQNIQPLFLFLTCIIWDSALPFITVGLVMILMLNRLVDGSPDLLPRENTAYWFTDFDKMIFLILPFIGFCQLRRKVVHYVGSQAQVMRCDHSINRGHVDGHFDSKESCASCELVSTFHVLINWICMLSNLAFRPDDDSLNSFMSWYFPFIMKAMVKNSYVENMDSITVNSAAVSESQHRIMHYLHHIDCWAVFICDCFKPWVMWLPINDTVKIPYLLAVTVLRLRWCLDYHY